MYVEKYLTIDFARHGRPFLQREIVYIDNIFIYSYL